MQTHDHTISNARKEQFDGDHQDYGKTESWQISHNQSEERHNVTNMKISNARQTRGKQLQQQEKQAKRNEWKELQSTNQMTKIKRSHGHETPQEDEPGHTHTHAKI